MEKYPYPIAKPFEITEREKCLLTVIAYMLAEDLSIGGGLVGFALKISVVRGWVPLLSCALGVHLGCRGFAVDN